MNQEKQKNIRLKEHVFTKIHLLNHQQISSVVVGILVQTLRFFTGQTLLAQICFLSSDVYIPILNDLKTIIIKTDYSQNTIAFSMIGLGILIINFLYLIYYFTPLNKTKKLKIDFLVYSSCIIFKCLNQLVNIWLSIGLYNSYITADYANIFLFAMCLITSLICWKILVSLQRKNQFWSRDYNIRKINISSILIEIAFSLITILFMLLYLSGNLQSTIQKQILIVFILVLQLLKMKCSILSSQYQQKQMKSFYCFTTCFQLVTLIALTLYFYLRLQILVNNIITFEISISIFMWWAIQNYQNWLDQNSYFWQNDQIQSKNTFYRVMNSYFRLYNTISQQSINQNDSKQSRTKKKSKQSNGGSSSTSSQFDLILSSMRKSHQHKCQNINCFCQNESINNSLKQYLRFFIIQQLKYFENKFYHNLQIQLYIIEFKFHVLGIYQNVLNQIKILQIKNNLVTDQDNKSTSFISSLLSILHQYNIFAIQFDLKDFIKKRNHQSRSLNVQKLLYLEVIIADLNATIDKDIVIKRKKWMSLCKNLCRIQQLRTMSENQLDNMQTIFTTYQQNFQKFNRSSKFNLILLFYYDKLIQKQDIVKKLMVNIKLIIQKFKPQQLNNLDVFNKMIFNPKCCIVMSLIDTKAIGLIFNASKTIQNVFGYSQKKIIGQSIDKLIPQYMKTQHKQIFKKWIQQEGKWKQIAKICEVYCENKHNQCFSSFKYMKITIHQNELYFLTTFFKKNDNDMILLNMNTNRVQTAGKRFLSLIGRHFEQIELHHIIQDIEKLRKKSNTQYFKQDNLKVYDQKTRKKALQLKIKSNFESQGNQSKQQLNNNIIQKLRQQSQNCYWSFRVQYKSLKMNQKQFLIIQTKYIEPVGNAQIYVEIKSTKNTRDFTLSYETLNIQNKKSSQQKSNSQPKLVNENKDNMTPNQNCFQGSVSGINIKSQDPDQEIKIQLQQKSSMTSTNSDMGVTMSKLIEIFSQYFFGIRKLQNLRQNVFLIINSIITLGLIAILIYTLQQNSCSINQKTTLMLSKSRIDSIFNMLENSQSDLFSLYEFKSAAGYEDQFANTLTAVPGDFYALLSEVTNKLKTLMTDLSPCQGVQLYDFINNPIMWAFSQDHFEQMQFITFLTMMQHLAMQLTDQFQKVPQLRNMTNIARIYKVMIINTVNARSLRDGLLQNNLDQMNSEYESNNIFLIEQLIMFALCSVLLCVFQNHYSAFSFNQKLKHLDMYLNLSGQQIQNITDYYQFLYIRIKQKKQPIQTIYQKELDQEPMLIVKNNQVEDCLVQEGTKLLQKSKSKKSTSANNTITFIGQQNYIKWIFYSIILIVCLVINTVVGYKIDSVNSQVVQVTQIVNKISKSYSYSLFNFNCIIGMYYFNMTGITPDYIDSLLAKYQYPQTNFASNTTTPGNPIIDGDPTFWADFNHLLLGRLCDVNRQLFPGDAYQYCIAQGVMSSHGIIVFSNYFQRVLKNIFYQLKAIVQKNIDDGIPTVINNSTLPDTLFTQDRFRQANIMGTFHVKTLQKLNARLIQAYVNGYNSLNSYCNVALVFLIILFTLAILLKIIMYPKQRRQLQKMYGYIFLIPNSILMANKYMLKFISQNLEFKQKY